MDMKDIDREIRDIKVPQYDRRRQVDLKAKNAGAKVIALRAIAALFFVAVALFGIYSVLNAKGTNMDPKIVTTISIIYVLLSVLVAYKLWNLDFVGWLVLFCISMAGIALPAISVYSRGIMVGTVPIIAVSVATLIVLWWAKDLFGIKKIGDFFSPH